MEQRLRRGDECGAVQSLWQSSRARGKHCECDAFPTTTTPPNCFVVVCVVVPAVSVAEPHDPTGLRPV